MTRPLIIAITMAAASACILLWLTARNVAYGHEAPMGWSYGAECCSSADCSQRPEGEISTVEGGYRVNTTGEIIPYSDYRIKRSRDEFYHRCAAGGDMSAKHSICLYVPDQGF